MCASHAAEPGELDEEGQQIERYEDGGDPAGGDPESAEAAPEGGSDEPDEAAEDHVAGCGDEGGCETGGGWF